MQEWEAGKPHEVEVKVKGNAMHASRTADLPRRYRPEFRNFGNPYNLRVQKLGEMEDSPKVIHAEVT